MSPLSQKIIDKLSSELDEQVLVEVLDFYEYIKNKKRNKNNLSWADIMEDEPTAEERRILDGYDESEDVLSNFSSLVQELRADD